MKIKVLTFTALMIILAQVNTLAATLGELTEEQKEVKDQISDVNDKILDYEDDINEIKDDIAENDEKIKQLEKDIKSNEKIIEGYRDEVDSTLRLMQRMNNTNTIVTYFYDENTLDNNYFLKVENINTMFESLSTDIKVFIDEIEATKVDIEEINKISEESATDLEELNKKIKEQEELEINLKEELADIEEEIGKVALKSSGSASASSKYEIMAAAGISSSDYTYVDYIVTKESNWNSTAANPMSSAYGLCQALPGSKMASAGSDWATNPVTQMRWCDSYATSRYGSWAAAYSFWISHHWW